MLGLNDDPTLARYGFSRRVDYCSGAALMFRRETWQAIGGFDENLAPAYCEDMEICLRLRDAGQEVWYVADSTVVHHLSRTTAAEGNDGQAADGGRQPAEGGGALAAADRQPERGAALRLLPAAVPPDPRERPLVGPWLHGMDECDPGGAAVSRATTSRSCPPTLGFYDLRLPEVMEAQAELARRHGIEGFCFYYYWFAGKRLLEQPIEAMLASGKPDFPFFLCWANENWTRRWDGEDAEVLIAQHHSPDDDEAVIRDMLRYMWDPRYVRVRRAAAAAGVPSGPAARLRRHRPAVARDLPRRGAGRDLPRRRRVLPALAHERRAGALRARRQRAVPAAWRPRAGRRRTGDGAPALRRAHLRLRGLGREVRRATLPCLAALPRGHARLGQHGAAG